MLFLVLFAAFGVWILGLCWYDRWTNEKMSGQAAIALRAYLTELRNGPTNPDLQAAFQSRILDRWGQYLTAAHAEVVYTLVLSHLESHPESQSLRTFALKVGRWQASRRRPERAPTSYDEAAILNDVLLRTNGTQQLVDLHR